MPEKPKIDNFDVFINCPFDKAYSDTFLRAIQFTILACGYTPRCAREEDNASDVRIAKLLRIMGECRYSINDISRTELDPKHQLPQFNMPFELGLFMGMAATSSVKRPKSSVLIMDSDPHRYDIFISDISGQDISCHYGTVDGIIQTVRNWLNKQQHGRTVFGSNRLQQLFAKFGQDSTKSLNTEGKSDADLCFNDWTKAIEAWFMRLSTTAPKPCPKCGK